MDPGFEKATIADIFWETIESLGGWKGILVITAALFIFQIGVTLWIQRRHIYNQQHKERIRKARQEQQRAEKEGLNKAA